MLSALQQSFWDRLMGVVTLQRPVYEALQRDPAATSQAWLIVVFLGLANGIALISTPLTAGLEDLPPELAAMFTFDTTEQQIMALVVGVIGAVLSWYLWAWLLRAIGNRMAGTGKQVSPDEMRRLVAWGNSPTLASFLTPIPIIGQLLATLGSLWAVVTGVMAVRTAFGIGIGKAIAIGIITLLVLVVAIAIVLTVAIVVWMAM